MQKANLFSVVKYGDHQRHFMKQNLLIGKLINEDFLPLQQVRKIRNHILQGEMWCAIENWGVADTIILIWAI